MCTPVQGLDSGDIPTELSYARGMQNSTAMLTQRPPIPGTAYVVGGAVRDALLGLPVNDRDWVVVGATPQQMLDAGFQPVGRDFPVFLHPRTHEEYALARTERKTAPGYRGFVVQTEAGVTLDDDLLRRDLTINAMAQDATGAIVDPHGGQRDLRAMVAAGEVDALVPERVWQELARGLMEAHPRRLFEVLRDCGALARILPEVDALWGVPQRADFHPEVDCGEHQMLVLQAAAQLDADLPVRWACLMHDLGKATTPAELLPRNIGHEARSVALARTVAQRLRLPADCAELATVVAAEHGNIHKCMEFGAEALLRLLARCDALRRPARFNQVLLACEADHRGRGGAFPRQPYPQRARLQAAFDAALAVDAGAIAQRVFAAGGKTTAIAQAVQAAREAVIAKLITQQGGD
jgi:tRNA nucleotidyltransferase (CCA-adding enzyme)